MKFDISRERIKRELEELKEFTSTPGYGCTRMPFSEEAKKAVAYLKMRMESAGLTVKEDPAGNIFGIFPGADRDLPCVMVGSHYDSVTNGGDFDGIAGIICGIEIARIMKEKNVVPKRDFVVAGFNDEEGMRFGTGYFGSGAILGLRDPEYLINYKDKEGISIYEAMEQYGLDPKMISSAKWKEGSIGKYLEIHIEQGPVLHRNNVEIGIVSCIVGIQRYIVTVFGRADHAGTTPMDLRLDPVDAASEVISKIPQWAREEGEGTVATVGYVNTVPGGINIVADKAEFSVDIRSGDNDIINRIASKINNQLKLSSERTGCSFEMVEKLRIEPVQLSEKMYKVMEDKCTEWGFSHRRLPSGAGHDCLEIGQHIPSAMLFVPSRDGRSHCPEEHTDYEYFSKAANIMSELVIELLEE